MYIVHTIINLHNMQLLTSTRKLKQIVYFFLYNLFKLRIQKSIGLQDQDMHLGTGGSTSSPKRTSSHGTGHLSNEEHMKEF